MSLDVFHGRKAELGRLLGEVGAIAERVGTKTVASKVRDELVPKLEGERFHLVVVGEFNHGKTTLINALLGRPVLPTGVTPTTAVIHHIEYAEAPHARAVREGGAAEPVDFETLRAWAVGERGAVERGEVQYLEVFYPAGLLKNRVVLVDTPGVNDLSLQRADITYNYIPRSDAVLFLLDAGQLIKESERVFLCDKLLARSRDKIVFVVTKADIWSPDERAEALAYVREQLGRLVPSPVIFPVSAHQALAGRRDESGLGALVGHLERFLADERGRILLEHAAGEGLQAAGLVEKGVEAKRRALTMGRDELDRRIAFIAQDKEGQLKGLAGRRAAIRDEVIAIKAWVNRDVGTFTEDVLRQLPAVIDTSNTGDVRRHLSGFLETTFREWAQAETAEIAAALERLAERTIALVQQDAREAGRRLGEGLLLQTPTLDVDTFAYDVGVFALFTLGLGTMFANILLGGVLTLAAPLVALYLRDRVDVETKKRAKEVTPDVVRRATAQVGPKLEQLIDEFAARLDAWVVSAGEEIHREMLEVLTAARDERASAEAAAAPALSLLEAQARELQGARARLEAMRERLRSPEPVGASAGEGAAPDGTAGTRAGGAVGGQDAEAAAPALPRDAGAAWAPPAGEEPPTSPAAPPAAEASEAPDPDALAPPPAGDAGAEWASGASPPAGDAPAPTPAAPETDHAAKPNGVRDHAPPADDAGRKGAPEGPDRSQN
jgi:GTP-binding protein EngB required for normal cell division